MSRARALRLISLLLFVLAAAPLTAASRFDPALRFRSVATEHFIIYFHRGEERLAARLAQITEDVRRRLAPTLGVPRQGRTHVVLADQSELANGWASPLPYNTIVINAASPSGSEFIGNTDDWLRLVFAHEYAHIVHLDRSRGWSQVVRGVFGRMPLAMPNLFAPVWQIEGLATFAESNLTNAGRLNAGDFLALELEAARFGVFEPVDRLNGGLTRWPGGHAAYAYGGGFLGYLASNYGADKLARLADNTTRRVPFFTAGAFKEAYGYSFDHLWQEYRATMLGAVVRLDQRAPNQITHHGFEVLGPRFLPPTCPGCPGEVIYSLRTPHGFPTLNAVALDGSPPRQITTRYLGSTSGIGRNVVVFDQQELRRTVGLYSDLYSVDLESGDVTRLTNGKRLLDPDLSPDRHRIVAVREGLGRRDLVTLAAGGNEITVVVSEADTQFNAPRWSPDGRSIAVERHRGGAHSEVVIVSADTGAVRVIASAPDTRWVTPAWRPDGRAVIVAGAAAYVPFNLYEIGVEGPELTKRLLTNTTGGARWPDVSADGTTIVFVGYTVDGFDVFTTPYPLDPSGGPEPNVLLPPAVLPPAANPTVPAPADPAGINARRYNPLATLMPTSWEPVIETDGDRLRLGAGIAGNDVLAYHFYSAAATWRVDEPPHNGGEGPPLDWTLAYAYDRWIPTVFASASWETEFAGVSVSGASAPLVIPVRSRELEAGIMVPFRRVRISHQAIASLIRTDDHYQLVGEEVSLPRTAARVGWSTSSAKVFGFSISPERGVTVAATGESILEALGSTGSASTATGDLRAYVPGAGAHHVVAVRAAGGGSSGDRGARRVFLLGGASPASAVIDFDSDAISLLRGFEANAFAGNRVALINIEYRWPFARPERGFKTWPVFIHTAHAAAFADAGHAWSNEFRLADVKTSLGAELSADVVLGYSLRMTLTAGGAWGRDGQSGSNSATAYVRVGRAF
jgi:hypothetical protein